METRWCMAEAQGNPHSNKCTHAEWREYTEDTETNNLLCAALYVVIISFPKPMAGILEGLCSRQDAMATGRRLREFWISCFVVSSMFIAGRVVNKPS